MFALTVLPPSAAPSATVPPAKSKPKGDEKVRRAELTALASAMLEAAADLNGPAALEAAGAVLVEWIARRNTRLYGSDWIYYARALAGWLCQGGEGAPPHDVFADGNSKLPFPAFGTLPVFTCPGAGACANYCYSFTSWKNPAPFFRQVMNTLLLRHRPDVIRSAFLRLPHGSTVRLYTDGDFGSLEDVSFWMQTLRLRPDVRAYGYSKSWDLLVAYQQQTQGSWWASNYVLNLSSGGVSYASRSEMEGLPVTRGTFLTLAVRVGKGEGRYDRPEYVDGMKSAARAAGLERFFVCRGDCGSCGGHSGAVCANPTLRGLDVVVGTH